MTAQRFISGLHFIQFDHWPLRWLYFVAGLSGCVLIATGFLFWLESRRMRHAKKGLAGVRVVEALTITSVTGIVIATFAYFIVNRLLPLGATWGGWDRAELEVWAFHLAWIATLVHAFLRPARPATQPARRAWREQCAAIAVLAVVAVALNAATTGDHLVRTLGEGRWSVAGMDLMLLLSAGLAAWTCRRLGRDAPVRVSERPAATQAAVSREGVRGA
jgi:hypothetical protein